MRTKAKPRVRTGQAQWPMAKEEFRRRFRGHYLDPAFSAENPAIAALEEIAWRNYKESRKAPLVRKAGRGFANPDYELSTEWLSTRDAIRAASRVQRSAKSPSRVLLVCASSRNDKTCPGEVSKTWRLTKAAQAVLRAARMEVDLLDLSLLISEYDKVILPCKACVSTAMPLCHWPCSCYPNHALGQVNDWMNEIYPRWVAAHGVMIVTPVYWYQVPGGLKSMMDRLVCADGGNPDPTSTHGKNVPEAKALELKGWDYPKHLAGRAFGLVVHGDAEGADTVRRSLSDWLTDMELVPAGALSSIDRYIGYYEPYATSHEALDADNAVIEETRNVARSLVAKIKTIRRGEKPPGRGLREPRPK